MGHSHRSQQATGNRKMDTGHSSPDDDDDDAGAPLEEEPQQQCQNNEIHCSNGILYNSCCSSTEVENHQEIDKSVVILLS